MGFECKINTQNLMEIVGDIFEKMKILHFFFCELPLILRVCEKQKYGLDIFAIEPYISNLNEIISWFRPYVRRWKKCLKYLSVSGIFPGKVNSVTCWGLNVQ